RPKTHICNMSGFLESCPDVVTAFAVESGSMQDWILAYLFSGEESDYLKKAMDEGTSIASGQAEYQVWRPAPDVPDEDAVQDAVIPAEPDWQSVQRMQKQLSYQYDARLTELPAKRSVTSLSHQESDFAEQADLPDFMLEDEEGRIRRLRGAARGTAIHKIMQFMDFKKASEDPEAELERMQKADILEPIEAESIRTERIRAFFNSDLYRRIAVSDAVMKEKQLFVQIGKLHLPETSPLLQSYRGTDGIMIGTVDLLFHEPDGWVLVDYKTDRASHADELSEKYAHQLGLYQKAMELVLNQPVKQTYLYAFSLDEAIEIDTSALDYEI
ncbi:MAG: PD-(D/E)XK nuclease family protein, partial [Oscillospiraceae bacterium]|nr:PD-(D/E)XK nuclease family protein [Oscillospiraceae bacterium]